MGIYNSGPTHVCPPPPSPIDDASPIVGSLTLKRLSIYVSGSCMGTAFLVSAILMFLHATHLSRPAEQIKTIRIIALIPTFALMYFITIYLGLSAVYLMPWVKVFESVALASFFFLACDYLSPNLTAPVNQTIHLGLKEDSAPLSSEDLKDIRNTRTLACQYIGVATIFAIVTDITHATGHFCPSSNKPHFAHIWVTVLHAISATIAITSIILFTTRVQSRLRSEGIIAKLVAFKLAVTLDLFQILAFSIAGAQFHPSRALSYLGLVVYLPAIIFCVQTVVFAFVFHYVYSYRPYVTDPSTKSTYHGGPLGIYAFVKAFNPVNIFRETLLPI